MYKKIYFSLEVNEQYMILVAQNFENNKSNVVGFHQVKTIGFENNIVTNQNDFVKQLKKLVKDFEEKNLMKVTQTSVVINSKNINTVIRTKILNLDKNKTVDHVEIKLALDSLKNSITTDVKTVTCALPLTYKVDGEKVLSPVGYNGKKLEIKTLLISSPTTELYSLLYAVELAGLKIIDITPSFIANVFNSFDAQDNRKRVMLLDFGFNSSQVIHFDSGVVQNVFNLDFGLNSVKNEIKDLFKIEDELFDETFEVVYKTKISKLDQKVILKCLDGKEKSFNLSDFKIKVDEILEQTLIYVKTMISESVIDFSQVIVSNVLADVENIYTISLESMQRETKIIKNDPSIFDNSYYTNVIGMNYYTMYLEELVGINVEASEVSQAKYIKNIQPISITQPVPKQKEIEMAKVEKNVEKDDDDELVEVEVEVVTKKSSAISHWWSKLKNKLFDNKGENYDE